MFRHRQQLRRWAARVLLFWLFGLGASVANACLASGQAAPLAASASPPAASMEAEHDGISHHPAADDAGVLSPHGAHALAHHGSLAKANCKAFCDQAAVSIPPLKSPLDGAMSHAGTASVAVTVLPVPALAPVQAWLPRLDCARAPPIPIAFLRLAL